MSKRLQDKVVIITGAATGIGRAIAYRFAREGAKVLVCDLPGEPVEKVVETIRRRGASAAGFSGDISQEDQAGACVQKAIEEFGRLDVLVNNVGVLPADRMQDVSLEQFDQIVTQNVRATCLMTKAALPHLQQTRGNIISAGSEIERAGASRSSACGGSEAWIHAFMRSVAVEQAPCGVRANSVCLAPGESAAAEYARPLDTEMEEMFRLAAPPSRQASAGEIAEVYCFLASEEAGFVSGALFLVDGGVAGKPAASAAGRKSRRPAA